MSETETGSDTESWEQLLRPTTRQDLLTLSLTKTKARARQVADSPEERTQRLLEDIERGIQKRLDEWCQERTQDIRRTKKNVLRALRKRREKQTGPRQYTYPEIMRLVQARIQRTLDNTPNIIYPRPRIYAPRRKKPRCLPEPSHAIPELRRKAYTSYPTYLGSDRDLFNFYRLDGTLVESGISPHRSREHYHRVGADIYTRGGRKPHVRDVGHLLVDCVDMEYGQPLYSYTTLGSRHEGPLALRIIDGYHAWYGYYPGIVVLDKAYDSQELVQGLIERGIQPYIQARDYGQKDLIRLGEHWNLKTRHLSDIQIHPGFLKRVISLRTDTGDPPAKTQATAGVE